MLNLFSSWTRLKSFPVEVAHPQDANSDSLDKTERTRVLCSPDRIDTFIAPSNMLKKSKISYFCSRTCGHPTEVETNKKK